MIKWDEDRIRQVCKLRLDGHHPTEIADMMNTTYSNVHRILSQVKKSMGYRYPKLRHGLLKYDNATVNRWRSMVSAGCSYSEIGQQENVNKVLISIKFRQQLDGTLQF